MALGSKRFTLQILPVVFLGLGLAVAVILSLQRQNLLPQAETSGVCSTGNIGEFQCNGQRLEQCDNDPQPPHWEVRTTCTGNLVCQTNPPLCVPATPTPTLSCIEGHRKCADYDQDIILRCNSIGNWIWNESCTGANNCSQTTSSTAECQPAPIVCSPYAFIRCGTPSNTNVVYCDAWGTEELLYECPAGMSCSESERQCVCDTELGCVVTPTPTVSQPIDCSACSGWTSSYSCGDHNCSSTQRFFQPQSCPINAPDACFQGQCFEATECTIPTNTPIPGSTSTPTPSPSTQGASCVSHTIPTSLYTGSTTPVSVTMRNTSTSIWTGRDNYLLGSQDPENNLRWGTNRDQLETATGPNSTTTFSFNITAPTTPGQYSSRWQMLQEGVQWFGDLCGPLAITVTVPPTPTITPTPIKDCSDATSGTNSDFNNICTIRTAQTIILGDIVTTESTPANLDTGDDGIQNSSNQQLESITYNRGQTYQFWHVTPSQYLNFSPYSLFVWADWDGNGGSSPVQLYGNTNSSTVSPQFSVTIPSTATNTAYIRAIVMQPTGILTSSGYNTDNLTGGEVEDYQISIANAPLSCAPTPTYPSNGAVVYVPNLVSWAVIATWTKCPGTTYSQIQVGHTNSQGMPVFNYPVQTITGSSHSIGSDANLPHNRLWRIRSCTDSTCSSASAWVTSSFSVQVQQDSYLTIKVKFQGITSVPENPVWTGTVTVDQVYPGVQFVASNGGVYTATISHIPQGTYPHVYIKTGSHLRRDIGPLTIDAPTEVLDVSSRSDDLIIIGDFTDQDTPNALTVVDIGLLLSEYLSLSTSASNSVYDVNRDNMLTISDIGLVLSNYIALVIAGDP